MRPQTSQQLDNNDHDCDRRSVLQSLGGGYGSAVVAVASYGTGTLAAGATPLPNKRTVNYPRLHPGLRVVGNASSNLLCECFVDFCCPYSRKLFNTLSPIITGDSHDEPQQQIALVYHNVIQPWHHQSLWLHESALAVRVLYPEAEMAYWEALFVDAPRWYDENVYDMKRGDFYDKIATFAAGVVENHYNNNLQKSAIKARILQYLIPPKQKGGNFPKEAVALLGSGPDDDENALFPLTKQVVKFQRKRGVHVTPTVFFNGIEQTQISSSWTSEEWNDFLREACAG